MNAKIKLLAFAHESKIAFLSLEILWSKIKQMLEWL
jgi:hypothetical protein